jgi:excisionase family DNA binding protein
MVVIALELAARQAGAAGVNYRGRDRYDDFAWLLEVCRAGAVTSGDAAGGTEAIRWTWTPAASDGTWSTRQAAALLKVTPRAVVKAIGTGDLPAERVGREWVLREAVVRQYAVTRNGSRRPRCQDEGSG